MRIIPTIAVMLVAASSNAVAAGSSVTPQKLALAINKADAELVPYRTRTISPRDVRMVRCIAPEEEPTEFRCRWQQRTDRGWVGRVTWLAIDGNGWHVMDA